MRQIIFLSFLIISSLSLFSQATVRGKVIDDTGYPCIGASIQFLNDLSKGVSTDFDGNFSIKVPANQETVLLIKYIGFADQKISVSPVEDEVQVVEVHMKTSAIVLDQAVTIVAKANRANDGYMEKIKRNSATSIDYISNATLRKTGDSDMGAAVKRVSGVSTVGSYVSVRGLADRYLVTTVNGSRIPTLDPFTNNIRLDMFPSGLVDNLVVTKTNSGTLPGDWSGAYLSIETKDYPDNLDIRVNTSFGYNSNSTFKDIHTNQHSSTDWLGYDNGFRDVPDLVTAYGNNQLPRVFNSQSYIPYPVLEQINVDGVSLSSVMNEYGITDASIGLTPGQPLFNFLMHHIGLLPAGLINDPVAIARAEKEFNTQYLLPAIGTLNQRVLNVSRAFNHENTYLRQERASLDFTQSFSIGNQIELFGKPLGYVFGFKYSKRTKSDPNAFRGNVNNDIPSSFDAGDIPSDSLYTSYNSQQVSNIEHGLSAMAKLSYKFNSNNSISVMFMPNQMGSDQARRGFILDYDNTKNVFLDIQKFYEERKQFVYQLRSEHVLPKSKTKIQVNASYADGESNTLDFMDYTLEFQGISDTDVNLGQDIEEQLDGIPLEFSSDTETPSRSYRYLDEDILDLRLDGEIPIAPNFGEGKNFLRLGGFYRLHERNYDQDFYFLENTTGRPFALGDLGTFLGPENYVIPEDGMGNDFLLYSNGGSFEHNNLGESEVIGGHGAVDLLVNKRWRATAGLRLEQTKMFYDIRDFHERGLTDDDPDRNTLRAAQVDEENLLPAANLVYKLREDEKKAINLKLSYFGSIARPGLREITQQSLYEYVLQEQVVGNSSLKITEVENFDLRVESYFQGKGNISVSLFYKDFKNHIELVREANLSWRNADKSYARGIEIEGKWKLPKNFEILGNISYIESETRFSDGAGGEVTRAMFGQAPYILNSTLSYTPDSLGLQLALSYNRQGPKLAVVESSGVANNSELANVFEMPLNRLDAKVSKTFGEHWSISLKVQNILNESRRRAYDFENYKNEYFFDRINWGTTYTLGLSFKL